MWSTLHLIKCFIEFKKKENKKNNKKIIYLATHVGSKIGSDTRVYTVWHPLPPTRVTRGPQRVTREGCTAGALMHSFRSFFLCVIHGMGFYCM